MAEIHRGGSGVLLGTLSSAQDERNEEAPGVLHSKGANPRRASVTRVTDG